MTLLPRDLAPRQPSVQHRLRYGFVQRRAVAFRRALRILEPGLITGAADDDPSGIATYTQTGAQFGYGQLWMAVAMLPFQTAVQEACARIGAVTGKGLAATVAERYNRTVLVGIVGLVVLANIINIGADIEALVASTRLLMPVPAVPLAVAYALVIVVLQLTTPYAAYARVLKWLSLSLLAYVVTVFIATEPWSAILRATIVPHFEFNSAFFFIITGVLGTTISPYTNSARSDRPFHAVGSRAKHDRCPRKRYYMFFWQTSEEVEEQQLHSSSGVPVSAAIQRKFIRNLRIDTTIGMATSEVASWSMIVVGATVLHAHGVTTVTTAADAAKALEPLVHTFPHAGYLAKLVFATGVIGLGLLAIPVLSGSASYALCEAQGWPEGLNLKLHEGWAFYGVIMVATLIGLGFSFLGIDPIRALIFTAVFNGVTAAPLIFVIAHLAANPSVMGPFSSGPISKLLVWGTFAGMTAVVVAMLMSLAAAR